MAFHSDTLSRFLANQYVLQIHPALFSFISFSLERMAYIDSTISYIIYYGNDQLYKSSVEKSKYLKLVQPLNTHLHCILLEIYIFRIPLQSNTVPITQPFSHEGQTTQWSKEKICNQDSGRYNTTV